MAKNILAWSNVGAQFYREIGKRVNGKSPRFYLGADEKKAVANVTRLEALWDAVEERWQQWKQEDRTDDPFPCWDEVTLSLGRAIGKGDWTIKVEPPDDGPQEVAVWLASLRTHFPMIRVDVEDPQAVEEDSQAFIEYGKVEADKEEARHRKEMRAIKELVKPFGGIVVTKETLHDALDAYKAWIEKSFVDIGGRTTQTGKKQGERADRIKRYAKDMPLSDFGTDEIDAIIEFWRTRPKKPKGGPYALTLCKHTIRLFKHFVRWLHKEKSFPWKKPVDLDLDRIKIVPDTETKYKVETYSKEELVLLWQYASYFERQLLLLALNCGFSISEIGSLDWKEVEGNHIKVLRPKTKVYGEFKLWEMTQQALGDPKKKKPVFVTKTGSSLIAPTKGNNTSAKIPAAWYRLLNRVQKHHPGFKRLGFHHLRKTAGNFVRKLSDGETMGVFLRHGKPVKSDPLAGTYSNPVFSRVFDAQDRLWELLKDIFTPLEEIELPRKVSPETIRQIRSLKKQGIKTKKLSEMFGISPDRIRVYCRKT
jgi:integrase